MIHYLLQAIQRADTEDSRLPEIVTSIKSFTGAKVRTMLNLLCAPPDMVYLEIGAWNGGTAAAAAFGNPGSFTTVDNFKDFGGGAESVDEKFKEAGVNIRLIEADCWTIPMPHLPQEVNVFFWDGPHDYESHKRALPHFKDAMAHEFIFVVDDWEDPEVRAATSEGIHDAELTTLAYLWLGAGEHESGAGWWNGLGVFILRKQ